jgi:hypothetical protein
MEHLRRFLHPASERKGILDTQRMHANAGSRHGNGTYSRPTTLNSQPNHTRRMSHTIRTITIIVPTIPIPNIAPPRGHIAHHGCPCRHDRSGFRLLSEQNQTDHRNGICARSVEYVVVLIRICRCARVPPRSFGFPRKDSEGKYLHCILQRGRLLREMEMTRSRHRALQIEAILATASSS